jgi:hypothetical protein
MFQFLYSCLKPSHKGCLNPKAVLIYTLCVIGLWLSIVHPDMIVPIVDAIRGVPIPPK